MTLNQVRQIEGKRIQQIQVRLRILLYALFYVCLIVQVTGNDSFSKHEKSLYLPPQSFSIGPISCDVTSSKVRIIEKSLARFLSNEIERNLQEKGMTEHVRLSIDIEFFSPIHKIGKGARNRPHLEKRPHRKTKERISALHSVSQYSINQTIPLESQIYKFEYAGWVYFHDSSLSPRHFATIIEHSFQQSYFDFIKILHEEENIDMPYDMPCFSSLASIANDPTFQRTSLSYLQEPTPSNRVSTRENIAYLLYMIGSVLALILIIYSLLVVYRERRLEYNHASGRKLSLADIEADKHIYLRNLNPESLHSGSNSLLKSTYIEITENDQSSFPGKSNEDSSSSSTSDLRVNHMPNENKKTNMNISDESSNEMDTSRKGEQVPWETETPDIHSNTFEEDDRKDNDSFHPPKSEQNSIIRDHQLNWSLSQISIDIEDSQENSDENQIKFKENENDSSEKTSIGATKSTIDKLVDVDYQSGFEGMPANNTSSVDESIMHGSTMNHNQPTCCLISVHPEPYNTDQIKESLALQDSLLEYSNLWKDSLSDEAKSNTTHDISSTKPKVTQVDTTVDAQSLNKKANSSSPWYDSLFKLSYEWDPNPVKNLFTSNPAPLPRKKRQSTADKVFFIPYPASTVSSKVQTISDEDVNSTSASTFIVRPKATTIVQNDSFDDYKSVTAEDRRKYRIALDELFEHRFQGDIEQMNSEIWFKDSNRSLLRRKLEAIRRKTML